jgi:adenosylcobinamide kinase/adenosylcobinamide-phosphate guanylyltransferase
MEFLECIRFILSICSVGANYRRLSAVDATGARANLAPMAELIIGGARSGKSALAEQRARDSGLRVIYIATAQAGDEEMARRIAHHRARRPADWACVEAPLHLAAALREQAAADVFLMADCLTLWLSNLFFAGRAAARAEAGEAPDCPLLTAEADALVDALPALPGRIILVSNEVGCGIVPMHPVSRLFADEQGRLNQRIAAACQRVTLVTAGLPLELKNR